VSARYVEISSALARSAPVVSDHADPDGARLDAIEARLGDVERQLAELAGAHRSHAGHTRYLDRAAESIEAKARAAVQAARDAAREQREAKARAAAGDRVRVRAVRAADLWIGPTSARLRLDPANIRGDSCRLMDRAAWAAIVDRSDEVRAALDGGALVVVEDVAPDEAAATEVR